MTPFSFEHVFQAASVAEVFAAYFDPAHTVDQDRRMDIVERDVISLDDDPDELRRVCRVVPRRQIPRFIKPLFSGPLSYLETVAWRKRDNEIDIDIRPSILQGRASIKAVYRLEQVGIFTVQRRYAGAVSVDIALLSSRIERGIIAEFERSMPVAATCTQEWLDRSERSVAARA